MRVSVITPSFRNSEWLKLAVASVADQGVDAEHIVQDNCSNDDTAKWLPQDPRVKAFVESDNGMYDAINRGLKKSTGDICAYLNCDEQYLPGALQAVLDFFASNPDTDVLFAGAIVVDESGNYLCSRKPIIPLENHVRVSHLPIFSCATFFRRSILKDGKLFFDTKWKTVGDAEWVIRLIRANKRMSMISRFTSVFTNTGANLGESRTASAEREELLQTAPLLARTAAPLIVFHHRLRRILAGTYRQSPFDYSIYTKASPERRTVKNAAKPTAIWPSAPKPTIAAINVC